MGLSGISILFIVWQFGYVHTDQEPTVLRLNYGVYFNKIKSVSLTSGHWLHTMVLEIPTLDHFQQLSLPNCLNESIILDIPEQSPLDATTNIDNRIKAHNSFARKVIIAKDCELITKELIKFNELRQTTIEYFNRTLFNIKRNIPDSFVNAERLSKRSISFIPLIFKTIFGIADQIQIHLISLWLILKIF